MISLTVAAQTAAAMAAAHDIAEVGRIVRTAARRLVMADGATFVLAEGDNCFYEDEDAVAPLWKGQRFPQQHCISGWAMRRCEVAVVPDITVDARIPQEAYAPTFVRSLVMTPVGWPPVAAIGTYWATVRDFREAEVAALHDLAVLTAGAIERVGLDAAPWAPNFALDSPAAGSSPDALAGPDADPRVSRPSSG